MLLLLAIGACEGWIDFQVARILPFLPECLAWVEIRHLVVLFVMFGSLSLALFCLKEMVSEAKSVVEAVKFYSYLIPAVLTAGSYFTLCHDDHYFRENATFFYFAMGIVFTLVTSKVIISTMAQQQLTPF